MLATPCTCAIGRSFIDICGAKAIISTNGTQNPKTKKKQVKKKIRTNIVTKDEKGVVGDEITCVIFCFVLSFLCSILKKINGLNLQLRFALSR